MLAQVAKGDVYMYQLTVYNTVTSVRSKEGRLQIDQKCVQASVIATINDPIIHIREKEYLTCFKSALREYTRLNKTVRQDQLLSNLTFFARCFAGRVKFANLEDTVQAATHRRNDNKTNAENGSPMTANNKPGQTRNLKISKSDNAKSKTKQCNQHLHY
jgi:hypothetical protein